MTNAICYLCLADNGEHTTECRATPENAVSLEMGAAWRAGVEAAHRKEPPLLQCVDCKNTESPAGAMARYFNQGRCLHCGGWFKVVRA